MLTITYVYFHVCFLHRCLNPYAKRTAIEHTNYTKAVNLPLWSTCLPQRCQSCHRKGQTSCRCDAEHHAWAGSPFCRCIQTGPCSAAWGNLKIGTNRPIHAPSLQHRGAAVRGWGCRAQQRPVQHKEVQHWPAVVKSRTKPLASDPSGDLKETVRGCIASCSSTHLWYFK